MTASPAFRPTRAAPSMIEAALCGALFLGVVARLSLQLPGWLAPWLVLAPAASLAVAMALRLSRRRHGGAMAAAVAPLRRRRPARPMATRRRMHAPQRGRRLLAALALR